MFPQKHDPLHDARERNCRATEEVLGINPCTWIRLPIGCAEELLEECGVDRLQAIQAIGALHGGRDIRAIAIAIAHRATVGSVLANRYYKRTEWPHAPRTDQGTED